MAKTNEKQVAKRRRIVPPFHIIVTNLISNLTNIMSKHVSTMNPIQLYIIICLSYDGIFWCSANTTWLFGGFNVIHCKRLSSYVIHWKSMVEMFNFPSIWVGIIFILMATNEWIFFNIGRKTRKNMFSKLLFIILLAQTSFDLWMSHIGYNTFGIVVNFINNS